MDEKQLQALANERVKHNSLLNINLLIASWSGAEAALNAELTHHLGYKE
ncbi:transposase (fragment) [Klebsiella grimontii]|uniref:Transposase n=1 Tax=Klebsiella grimontii TaxID=2058152 RepID=A0A285B9D6_9ENTR